MFLLFYYEPPACQAPGRRRTETKIKRLLAAKKTKIERLLAAKKPKSKDRKLWTAVYSPNKVPFGSTLWGNVFETFSNVLFFNVEQKGNLSPKMMQMEYLQSHLPP